MTKRSRNRTWLVLGRLPPPLGGVTIYAQRFACRRRDRGDTVLNAFPSSWKAALLILQYVPKFPTYILVNSLAWPVLALTILFFPFSRKIAVDHNHSRKLIKRANEGKRLLEFQLAITRFLLKRMDRIWVVSSHLRPFYRDFNVPVRTIRPFIPPTLNEYGPAIQSYSQELRSLLSAQDRPILFAISAYKLVVEDGGDLYGFTRALDALRTLRRCNHDIRLIMFVADPEPTDLYRRIRREIQAPDIAPNVLWEEGQKPLWPLFRHVDAFLRPTQTDGWSISVEEALSMECPVIASDVVPRPSQCELFSLDSPSGLELALQKIVAKRQRTCANSAARRIASSKDAQTGASDP